MRLRIFVTAILLWNTHDGAVGAMVQYICAQYSVDVAVIIEDKRSVGEIFPSTGSVIEPLFDEYAPVESDIRYFVRQGAGSLRLIRDDGPRQSFREYTDGLGQSILIAGVHLPSKLRTKEGQQYFAARQLRNAIEAAEMAVGHDRTVLIGDMNMDPYEPGMSAVDSIHGVMDKAVALKVQRKVNGNLFKYFYNPMWSRIGDESTGPTGTYYRSADGVGSFFWHTFDQALVRPSLIPAYKRGFLKVIDNAGVSLVNGLKIKYSDHLPVLLKLVI